MLTKMDEEGMAYDVICPKRAQDKGYAERNPAADVEEEAMMPAAKLPF